MNFFLIVKKICLCQLIIQNSKLVCIIIQYIKRKKKICEFLLTRKSPLLRQNFLLPWALLTATQSGAPALHSRANQRHHFAEQSSPFCFLKKQCEGKKIFFFRDRLSCVFFKNSKIELFHLFFKSLFFIDFYYGNSFSKSNHSRYSK